MIKILSLVTSLILITSCGLNPNRAGCTYIDGNGRYGTFTQYAKGEARGAHIYIGENVKNVKMTCNADTQEVKSG